MTAVAVRGAESEPQSALLEEAATLRLVTRAEIVSGQVRTAAVPGASARTRVLLVRERPVAYVKSASGATALRGSSGRGLRVVGGPDWTAAQELAALERERQVLIELSATRLVPRMIAATSTAVWTAAVPGVDLGGFGRSGPPSLPDLLEIARGWGSVLGRLHGVPIPSDAPMCVRPDLVGAASGLRDHRLRELQELSAELEDRWHPTTWIHAGSGPRSVLFDPFEPIDVRLIGFGRAGVGDPGWDLALALECVADQARIRSLEPARVEEELLLGYRRAGGPARVAPAYRAMAAYWLVGDAWPTGQAIRALR